MRCLAIAITAVAAFVSNPLLALTHVELYQTEVVLDDTQDNAVNHARKIGMQEVLIRASGDPDIVNNEAIAKAISQNTKYLNQVSYGQRDELTTLKMRFSSEHIRDLLTQAKQPYWHSARPNVLVWLVEEQEFDRQIVWERTDSEVKSRLLATAQSRGLPLTLPLGDFDDITNVSISDLWGGFLNPIGQASQRYPVDAVLIIKQQGNTLRWSLYDQKPNTIGRERRSPLSGTQIGEDAADFVVNQITNYYAKNNAVLIASESSQSTLMQISGVKNAKDFFTLENQLKGLSSVARMDILKIQGDVVTLELALLASKEAFLSELSRVQRLTQKIPMVNSTTEDTFDNTLQLERADTIDSSLLEYQWRHIAVEMESPIPTSLKQDTEQPLVISADNIQSESQSTSQSEFVTSDAEAPQIQFTE